MSKNKISKEYVNYLETVYPGGAGDNSRVTSVIKSEIHNKFIVLDNSDRKEMNKLFQRKRSSQLELQKGELTLDPYEKHPPLSGSGKTISSRERKKKHLNTISKQNINYSQYKALNTLWKMYINKLIGKSVSNLNTLTMKLARADLHGAKILVCQSKCASLIGISGIMIKETLQTFKVVTKKNKLKSIPKDSCYFQICVHNKLVTLFGKHLILRPYERSSKKFKKRLPLQIVHKN